ncbi:MAG: hypothetical protein ACJ71W_12595 [Terriglobales bacterium]
MDRSDSWHDEAAPPTDNWLKNNIDPLIKSPALANSVFIIVFDESLDVDVVNGGGKIAWVMAGLPRQIRLQVHHFISAPKHAAAHTGLAWSRRPSGQFSHSADDAGVLSVKARGERPGFSAKTYVRHSTYMSDIVHTHPIEGVSLRYIFKRRLL